MRKLLRPVKGLGAFFLVLFDTDQLSVRENLVVILHGNDHLIGHLVMGKIIAGKPVVSPVWPGDCRDHLGVGRPFIVEEQAVLRVEGMVFD